MSGSALTALTWRRLASAGVFGSALLLSAASGASLAQAEEPQAAPTAAASGATGHENVPVPLARDALVRMDFQNVEIPTLVKFISEITGRNFVLD